MALTPKIKAIIIDDSAVVRQALGEILRSDPSIEVVAASSDPIFAMQHMEKNWPDVIILDLEMPRMDGLTFLRKIMAERPTPVIVCSTLAEKGAQTTMQVLSAGAVDVITKPKIGVHDFLYEVRMSFIDTVKAAARANLKKLKRNQEIATNNDVPVAAEPRFQKIPSATALGSEIPPKLSADAMLPPTARPMNQTTETVVVMGASTGGTQALELILRKLPLETPGIAIVQHMPSGFTAAFAERLNGLCAIEIKEAKNGDAIMPGRALIAPGNEHILLKRLGGKYFIEVKDGPVINRHRPSVDVLFRSAAQIAGKNAMGILLTGMGDDGARGMAELHSAGAYTIAQNEETCIVYGMPKEAIKRGAVDRVLALEHIADAILQGAPRRADTLAHKNTVLF